ncbi:thiamine phosphate synthase [Akkermansiaceae bacterium]|nr:thiamine phosphate synthase [Akkermansiaceae bacterium]
MKIAADARLYGIVDFGYVAEDAMEDVAAKLLSGGADILQLRAKGIPLETVAAAARKIIPLCKAAGVPFILNDYPELASELGADGVHIGQDDGAISDVRSRIADGMIIGRSTHSLAQARQALADGADYIGFGPLFPTPTKEGRPAIGLEEIAQMEKDVGSRFPAFCIGGIKPENLGEVIAAGARRCVIVSHLLTAPDISAATSALKSSIPAP